MPSSILGAYRAEVRAARQWWKEHRQGCVQCSRAMRQRPIGQRCATGIRILRYGEMNEEIVRKMAAEPDFEQPSLFTLEEL